MYVKGFKGHLCILFTLKVHSSNCRVNSTTPTSHFTIVMSLEARSFLHYATKHCNFIWPMSEVTQMHEVHHVKFSWENHWLQWNVLSLVTFCSLETMYNTEMHHLIRYKLDLFKCTVLSKWQVEVYLKQWFSLFFLTVCKNLCSILSRT